MNAKEASDGLLLKAGIPKEQLEEIHQLTKEAALSHIHMVTDVQKCKACERKEECVGTPAIGTGSKNSDVMIVFRFPSVQETTNNIPFISPEAQLITYMMSKAGINRNRVYITYAVKCSSVLEKGPEQEDSAACLSHLIHEIAIIRPKRILALGPEAEKQVELALRQTDDSIQVIATEDPLVLFSDAIEEDRTSAKASIWNGLKDVWRGLE